MNARQMSTEELLAKAAARPWIASGNQLRTTKQIAVATMIYAGNEGTQANAELIRRAVGSFELMQSTLQACANLAGEIKAGACADWRLDAIMEEAQKALALADAK